MRHSMFAATVVVGMLATPLHAADQTVRGRTLSVSAGASGRKVIVDAVEPASDDTVVGDPRTAGATLRMSVYGTLPGAQVVDLPAAHWTADRGGGFVYDDAAGTDGPVRRARLKRSRGTFHVKLVLVGTPATLAIAPPDAGTGACALLSVAGGDSYSVRFGDGRMLNRRGKSFRVLRPQNEGSCIPCGNGFPDAGESCDPSGVACNDPAACLPDCTCLYTAPTQPSLAFDQQAAVAANGSYPSADPLTVCGANDRRFLAELVNGNPLGYKVPLRLADVKPAGSNIAISGVASNISLGNGDFPFDHTFGSDFNMDVALDAPYASAAQNFGVVGGTLHIELAEGQFPHAERAAGPATGEAWETMSAESRQGIHEQFIPDESARVAVMGHWIVDCGHLNFQTEIHPLTFMGNARTAGTATVVDAFYNPYRETQYYHMDPTRALAFDDTTRLTSVGSAPFPLALILSVLRLQDLGPAPYQSIDHMESWAMLDANRNSPVAWRVCAPAGTTGRRLDLRWHWITRPGVQITVTPETATSCAVVQADVGGTTIAAPAPRVCVTPWDFLNEVAGEEAGISNLDLKAQLAAFIPAQFQSRLDPDPIMNCYDALAGMAPESPPTGQRVDVVPDLLLPFYGTISVQLAAE